MKQTYYSQSLCQIHKEPFTNICIDINCLQPLCPECIDIHLREHKNCQIDSLKQCRSNCSKKIKHSITELNQLLTLQEIETLNDPQKYIDECNQILQNFKKQTFILIEQHCKHLLTEISSGLNLTYRDSQIKEITQRINHLISQLDQLSSNLDTNKDEHSSDIQIDTIKSICLLNTSHLITSSQNEVKKEIQKLRFPLINLDQQFQKQITETLQKSIHTVIKPQFIEQQNSTIITPRLSQLSTQPQLKSNEFDIRQANYFEQNVQNPYLFYFPFNTQDIILYNVNLNSNQKQKITLKIDIKIPVFHTSIITKFGQIYLLGGTIPDKQFPNNKSNAIYTYDHEKRIILKIGQMIQGRSSHSSVEIGDYIYSVSGLTNNSVIFRSFERFNKILKKSELLQECQYETVASVSINFNNEYIYKFGGLCDQQKLNSIERFSLKQMIWQTIDPDINTQDIPKFKGFLQFSSGIQISEHNIFIFGGYDERGQAMNSTFIFNCSNNQHILQQVDDKLLLNKGGFWNQQCIIHNGYLFGLQNIENESGEVQNEQRRMIKFNKNWLNI